MKLVERPPVEVNGRGDDLDGILRAFFRAEMPDPWPPLRLPDEAPAVLPMQAQPRPPRRWFRRSHLALAASVALLIIGHLILSDTLKPNASAPDLGPSDVIKARLSRDLLPSKNDGPAPPQAPDGPPSDGMGKGNGPYKLLESLLQEGDKPTEVRITIIPNN